MASNSFGNHFRITTWGESHGKAIGVLIDGCPAGLPLTDCDINLKLAKRAPGRSPHTSPRKEPDQAEILSGTFEGITTGTPISVIIPNVDADSSKYEAIKNLRRPGHANYPYIEKYGIFDYRGGGRASGRETACRVAAGAVASKLLAHQNIKISTYLTGVEEEELVQAKEEGDSLGGIVELLIENLPVGLGEPIYQKLDGQLAAAMMSIPAAKGVELGKGFAAAAMKGSEHNQYPDGILGGLATGDPVHLRVAFKPTSSIKKEQDSVDLQGNPAKFKLPEGSRHDPCLAIRAVPVVEAMAALVVVDLFLTNLIQGRYRGVENDQEVLQTTSRANL